MLIARMVSKQHMQRTLYSDEFTRHAIQALVCFVSINVGVSQCKRLSSGIMTGGGSYNSLVFFSNFHLDGESSLFTPNLLKSIVLIKLLFSLKRKIDSKPYSWI